MSRRRRSLSDLLVRARAALCPYVSPEGLSCDQGPIASKDSKTRQQLKASDSIPLPRGVGLSFDLTTGRLKFPALTWVIDDQAKQWQDNFSSRTFLVPNHVTLVPVFKDTSISVNGEAVYRTYSNSLVCITEF
jgi:hypothetical protein